MLPLLISTALAAAPSAPIVGADGTVRVELRTTLSPADARAALDTATEALSLLAGTSVSATPDGTCERLRVTTKRLTYSSRRCPTERGWVETLIESNAYSSYEAQWNIAPTDGGALVTWQVRAEITGVAPIILNFAMGEDLKKAASAFVKSHPG